MMTTTSHRAAHIWFIDDNPSDLMLTEAILEDEGVVLKLRGFTNGTAALSELAQDHTGESFPDAIIMDLNMPDISGTNMLKALKSYDRTKNIPAFVMSGSEAGSDKKTTQTLGAAGYIVKPVSREKLAFAVERTEHMYGFTEGESYHICKQETASDKKDAYVFPEAFVIA